MLYKNFIKPVADRIIGFLLLIVSSPILLFLLIFIPIESKGSPIFRQTRVGRYGKVFTIYKLRSMKGDAEKLGPYSTSRNDPRVTKIGKFIRATSLDELPQFWNLLNGTMSLIGPRPDVPAQRELYSARQWEERLSVNPGLTGLAQARLRSTSTNEERLALDLQYVRSLSYRLDMKIVALTLRAIFIRSLSN